MKKILCIVLTLIVVFTACLTSVSAFSDDSIRLYRKSFTDKYVKPYDAADGYYFYFEQYYGYENNDPDGDIEWVLVYAGDMSYQKGKFKQVVGSRVFYSDEISSPFKFKYAVYDVKADEFYDLSDELIAKYDGLYEALIDENAGVPLGDADMDKELSILDATQIQLACARITKFDENDALTEYTDCESGFTYISDINRDGERDIMDATGVQLYLVEHPQKPDFGPDDMM